MTIVYVLLAFAVGFLLGIFTAALVVMGDDKKKRP